MSAKTVKAFQAYLVRQGKAPANAPDVYRGVWWPHTETVQEKPEPAVQEKQDDNDPV